MKTGKILLFAALNGLFSVHSVAQTWTQTSAPSNSWSCIAMSADGSRIIANVANAGIDAGLVYFSTNAGATWSHSSSFGPYHFFNMMAASADGRKLVAADNSLLYMSTNSGATWATIDNSSIGSVSSLAVSPDGKKWAVVASQRVCVSTNSGSAWTLTPLGNTPLGQIVSSADGNTLAVLTAGDFPVFYVSTNSGTTWRTNKNLPGHSSRVAVSVDGKKMFVTGFNLDALGVCISTNVGITWITNSSLNKQFFAVASSANGDKLAAVVANSGFKIYTSTDTGIIWVSNNITSQQWNSVISSSDGDRLVAWLAVTGPIYLGQIVPDPRLALTSANSGFSLLWLVPSTNFVLQSSADLSTWIDLTNTPVLNLTNLQDEVTLPFVGGNSFYRLKTP